MRLTELDDLVFDELPEAGRSPAVARRVTRLAVRHVRRHDGNLLTLRNAVEEDYRKTYGIDPITISILISLIFHIASLVLQWWQGRRRVTRDAPSVAEEELATMETEAARYLESE